MQVGAQQITQLTTIQRQRALSRPQPASQPETAPRTDKSRETFSNHSNQSLQGEFVPLSASKPNFEQIQGISFSTREALETYAETESFQPRSAGGELVGIDLYV